VAMEGSRLLVRVKPGTSQLLHHPSVDVLFDSVATTVGARAIGIVLTGMGHDGAEGLAALRGAGATTLVESPATAIIDGMPNAARPFADHVVDLPRIADAIVDLCATLPPVEEEGV
jgi:two-component system, chemotaxis family, protein-glutamate methylesterase/glutaminase